jgi:hypothetical protein
VLNKQKWKRNSKRKIKIWQIMRSDAL